MKRIFYTFSLSISFLLTGMDNSSIANVSAAHLISAMENNDFLLAKQLLKINPKIMHKEVTLDFSKNITSPFHRSPNKKWSRLFIENGADINRQDNRGKTLLNRICADDTITCDTSHALYLINCGANINHIDDTGNSILHNIIRYNAINAPAWVHFLLKHNVDINKHNKDGQTAFDQAIMTSKTDIIKCFEKAGIMFFSFVNDYNPYDLLKNDAHNFKKILKKLCNEKNNDHTVECQLAELFIFIKKCNRRSKHYKTKYSPSTHGIIINFYGYIFRDTSIYELNGWVGKEGVSYAKAHFKNLCKQAATILVTSKDLKGFISFIDTYPFIMNYCKKLRSKVCEYIITDMKQCIFMQNESKIIICYILNHIKKINFVDHNGNNLLHRTVRAHNVPLFKLLMRKNFQKNTDFTAKNNEDLTPLGIAKKHNYTQCIQVFYKELANKLAHINKNDDYYCKQVLQFLNEECDINRLSATKETLLLNLSTYKNINSLWYSFLVQKGAKINIQDHSGQSPLRNMINHSDICWLPDNPKRIIKIINLFIANGAIVTKTMLNDTNNEEIKKILQKAYDEQACCICMENPVEMNEIPCNNTHKGSFLCKQCYENIKQHNNLCPLDREPLNKYKSFK